MELPNVVCVDAKGLELEDDRLHLTAKAQRGRKNSPTMGGGNDAVSLAGSLRDLRRHWAH
ncbi:hypothetical protein GBA52_027643 [Prunus armeniaca]|nr:hypothetical protein GBA52_027643 [Prunus armeniaca]